MPIWWVESGLVSAQAHVREELGGEIAGRRRRGALSVAVLRLGMGGSYAGEDRGVAIFVMI